MIEHLDHLAMTTVDESACVQFHVELLGMQLEHFGDGRKALCFGSQKINLHVKGRKSESTAHAPVPGALDLCFIANRPLDQVIAILRGKGARIVEGPVSRTGASGPIRSICLRDPALNLVEIAAPLACG